METKGMRDLSPLLRPQSIAMVGASSDPSRGNGRTLRYLIEGGFAGELFAVNPRRTDVQGLRSWPCIADVPQAVDAAIVALPADSVPGALRECAEAGVRSAIVFAGGFAEMGEAGRAAQAAITGIAQDAGMLLLGPNSLGAYDARSRSFMTFSSMFEEGFAEGGRMGMVTQSGGWGSQARRLAADRGLSILQWVSTGNEADVDAAEVLHAMALDPEIDVILLYLEGVRNGRRLQEALETARASRKPVVAIKVGRSMAGRKAAASHTASLTGEDRVFDAVCRSFGVHRADSIEELLDVAYAALHAIRHRRMPAGPSTVVLSPSGGFAVHMTDQAVQHGLELPEPPPSVKRAILDMIPYASASNPVDITGQVLNQLDDFGRALDMLLAGDCYDAASVFVGMAGSAPGLREGWLSTLSAAAANRPGKWLCLSILARPETIRQYENAGFAVFEDTSRMLTAHAALVKAQAAFARPKLQAAAPMAGQASWPGKTASEVDAKRILAGLGVPLPAESVCADAREAGVVAGRLGVPVALKVVSPDIQHKTEVGGVMLNLSGAEAVQSAVLAMDKSVRTACPGADIHGYLVSAMTPAGVDVVVGVRQDPALGAFVMFGAGGVMAEWLDDVSVRMAPVDAQEARAMIGETRISKLLNGWRGSPASDVEALVSAICAISACASFSGKPHDFEVNPLRVLPSGQGVVALDALIVSSS